MGIRLWLPLPGPFIATSKGRAEKAYLRDRNAQRKLDRYNAMSHRQRSLAGFRLALTGLAVIVFVLWSAFGTTTGIITLGLALLWLGRLTRQKAEQGLKPWEDPAPDDD